MKVSELFEEYAAPTKNPKLGYNDRAKIPVGGTKEWMKSFGATDTHIQQALRQVRASAVYKKIKDLGMQDVSTDRNSKLGSIQFVGKISSANGDSTKLLDRRMKLTVQANGKIDETSPNDYHRAPMASGKPRIVPGDPVSSIAKTMEAAMEKMVANLTNRRAKEAKHTELVKKTVAKASAAK